MCQDYVTEKFFRRLQRFMVPIVLERQNFEYLCPEYKKPWFIAVDDFGSVRELAAYLKYLDGNDTAYYEYLRWHEYYETVAYVNSDIQDHGQSHWCDLCYIARRREPRIIDDVEKWWKEGACHLPS